MDPLFMSISLFRRRKFDDCLEICTQMLNKNPYDQAFWHLKTRALTEKVYVDEAEMDDEGIAETLLDDNSIAQVARPGTSLKKPGPGQGVPSPGMRPTTQSGRPLSGVVRPGTQSGRPGTMEQAIRTPRTAHTARPVTSTSGRFVRLGTASMLSSPDGPFINLARLNMEKYAQRPHLARALFEYMFHHDNDIRSALQLAAIATEFCQFNDWWWKLQLGKCYHRLGLYRDAERQIRSAIKTQPTVDGYLYLARVFVRLDQPLAAIENLKQGLEFFKGDCSLLKGIARVYEGLNDLVQSSAFYREVLQRDSTDIESIASIAAQHFYSDAPEVALKYYRRLLQMGVFNAEIFCNLGMCCFYAQQYDMTLSCFERALSLAEEEVIAADVWYNIGHVALGLADLNLAYQCFRLALASNNDHAEAYNNLGVLEMRREHHQQARTFFQASSQLAPHLFEAQFNLSQLTKEVGDLQSSYRAAERSHTAFPGHADSSELLDELRRLFSRL